MIMNYLDAILDWCKIKIPLSDKRPSLGFNEGEIWWCSIGMNVGEEVFGKGATFSRPVLIFKKFTSNSFLGLPLLGYERNGDWCVPIRMSDRVSSIMLNQARMFDRKRLTEKIFTMTESDFEGVREGFHECYCPKNFSPRPLEEGGDRWVTPTMPSG
jgi:mRNA interferase MazF